MKEVVTLDGVTLTYTKNEQKSVPGVGNVFNIHKEGTLVGWRVGIADIKKLNYKDLVDASGALIYDAKGKMNAKPKKAKKEVKPSPELTKALNVIDQIPNTGTGRFKTDKPNIANTPKPFIDQLRSLEANQDENRVMKGMPMNDADEPTTQTDKLVGGGFEIALKFRCTLKTKRRVTVNDVVQYLKKKYDIIGYEVESKVKEVK